MEETIDKVTFKFDGIKEISFSLNELPEDFKKDFDLGRVKTGMGFNLSGFPNLEKLVILITVTFDYALPGERNEKENILFNLINYVTKTEFKITDFKSTLKVDEKLQFFVPHYLLQSIVSTAISTTRGMLVSRLFGSFYSNIYLPIVDVNALIENQIGKEKMTKEVFIYKNKEISGHEAKKLREEGKFEIVNPELYRIMNQIQGREEVVIYFYEDGTFKIEPKNTSYEKSLIETVNTINEYRKKPVSEFIPFNKKK